MKRRIVTGVIISSLLVAQFTGVSVVFSDELQVKQSIEQSDEGVVSSFDDSITKDIFKESLVPISENNSEIKGTEDSIFETSTMSEEITETTQKAETSETIESTENKNEMETNSSNSEGIKEETTSSYSEELAESTEVIEKEKVFYNNQWLEFPIQKETVEVEKNQKTNNKLGTYAKPKDYASLSFEKITEEQTNRPKWDVIDVSSEHGELSVADYEYMKIQGVTGVVVKLTEGTYYKNPFAKIQIENAEKAGLKVSTYHFSHYTTKNGAEAEAIYYAEEAKRLNLTVNTVMVNNLELNLNEYATQNAIFFANMLKELGYGNLIHASSAKDFSEGKLLPAILGEEYLWIVDYQNQPTAENMQHLQSTAWKWSDKMEFTAIPGKSFGVSSDYQGKFSNSIQTVIDNPEKSKNSLDIFEKNINQYVTITTKDFVIWEDLTLKKEIYKGVDYVRQTLFAEKEFTLLNGMKILSITDNKKKHLGYINKLDTNIEEGAHGTHQRHGKYVSIKGNYDIWEDFDWKKSKLGSTYKNQTFEAREIYHHFNGSRYLSLYDNKGKWQGYINEWGTSSGDGDQGPYQNYGKYVSIKGNYNIWEGFDWKKSKLGSVYKNQTFEAKGIYHHFNGSRYLSLYDSNGKWQGYINEWGTTSGNGDQGPYQNYGKYVNIKGNYSIWEGFDWKKSKPGLNYKNQTLQARGVYHHFNGSRYLSLYDNKGKWIGYINEWGTTLGEGDHGPYQSYGKYVGIKGNYNIWEGFDWKKSKSGLNYKNQTLQARGIYHHFNGSRYLSLYDNKGVWVGYINEFGTTLGIGSHGPHQKYGEYVSIKGNYNIWEGFDWKKSKLGSTYKNQIFEAKGVYHHFNGSRYLSLYDSKGKWIGYINEVGTSISNNLQGNYKTYNKYVTVKSNTEPVYRNFNWVLQQTGKIGKETFKAKGVYHHFNGTRYFSIYDLKNKWIGYISENSVDEKPTHLFVMGHGSYDPGAVGNGTSEREFTRTELLPYLQKHAKKLKNSEVLFYDTSRNMYADSQKKEGVHTVHAGLSSITELHLDAAGVGATGGHVIVHPNKKSYKEDFELANVVKTYNGLWGGVAKTKGLSYRKDLLNLNLSYDYDVSYRLVELGFITNYKDLVKLRVNLDRIAKDFIEVVTGEKI